MLLDLRRVGQVSVEQFHALFNIFRSVHDDDSSSLILFQQTDVVVLGEVFDNVLILIRSFDLLVVVESAEKLSFDALFLLFWKIWNVL